MTDQQGIRKAAVFLNGLDWETAGLLLKRLPAEESRALRREMVAVEGISPSEINKTVRQFLKDTRYEGRGTRGEGREAGDERLGTRGEKRESLAPHPSPLAAYTDISHKTVSRCSGQTTLSADGMDCFELTGAEGRVEEREARDEERGTGDEGMGTRGEEIGNRDEGREPLISNPSSLAPHPSPIIPRRFDYLERRSAFDTAVFLSEEGEQLIAVVLSQLTPRYSGDVLACFEQSLKRNLIRRLAKLDATDETILDEIDAVLKDRLQREVEDRPKSKPGLALLEQILQVVENELDNDIGNDIISGLNEIDLEERLQEEWLQTSDFGLQETVSNTNPEARSLVPEAWDFEDLGMLDDFELSELFRSMDRNTLVQTLMSSDVYFVERVLGLFPVYEQITLRETLTRLQASGFGLQD